VPSTRVEADATDACAQAWHCNGSDVIGDALTRVTTVAEAPTLKGVDPAIHEAEAVCWADDCVRIDIEDCPAVDGHKRQITAETLPPVTE
jgi:hypothetical protein